MKFFKFKLVRSVLLYVMLCSSESLWAQCSSCLFNDATMNITVTFSGTHTYVSDIGFYLQSPNGTVVTLGPAYNNGYCNSGDNFTNLKFTNNSASTSTFKVCTMAAPLTGTYNGYFDGSNKTIDWSVINGENIYQAGWKLMVYDCYGGFVGTFTNGKIEISGKTVSSSCLAANSLIFDSGSINATINDNACNPSLAAKFEVSLVNSSGGSNCGPGAVSMTASGCTGGTISWYESLTGGSALTTGTSYITPSISATTAYYIDCTIGGCTISPRSQAVATINTIPAPTSTGGSRCGTGTVSMTASGCTGGTISWYESLTGGSALSTGTNFTTPSINTTTTYYIDCTVAGCTSLTRSQAVATITSISITPASQTNVSCNGGSNGAATINTPTGGTAGYTYSWSPSGGTAATASGLSAGTYTVTVTDANTCTATQSFTITQPTAITVTAASQTNIACNGGSNGAASINTPTGGAGGYTYSWSPSGGTATTATGLSAGTYTVTVTDANACTATQSFTITQPTTISTATAAQTNVSCNGGSNGSASVTPSGGAGGYTYSWSPSGGTAATATGLSAGTYTVTVTDANACTATQSFTITQPTAISTATAAQTNVSCNGGSNGSASVTPSGGAGGYTYSWSPSGGTAATATGLSAGSYTVTVTDANACTATRNFTITQPTTISTATAAQTNVSCNGGANGSASVTPSGGAGGYTYSWSPSGGTAATATGLSAGTYTVTVTDANTCTATQSFTITQPTAISTSTAAQTNVSCNGGSNGSASVTPSGGAGGYTYSWSPSGGTAATATGLSAGTYTVTVTDANACTATRNFTITQPTAITVTAASQTNIACNGGSNGAASINTPTGGAGGYTYSWSPSGGTAATATGLSAGTYTVTVTDANACTATRNFTITQPPIVTAPIITPPVSLVVCSPSSLTLIASGCAGTVTWSEGAATGTSLTLSTIGTYSITAICTDNGCISNASTAVTGLEIKAKPNAPTVNAPTEKVVCFPSTLTLTASPCAGTVTWSQGAATGSSLTLSTVGTYSITATCTVNGCTSDASTAVTGLEIKSKPNTPTVNAPTEKVVCFPSTLTLTASPCSGTVTWSEGAATGSSLTLSTIGTYSITAICTDNGCISNASSAVTGLEIKAKPNAPIVTVPTEKVVCFPSTLTLTASGCAGTITWSNATTGTSLTLSTVGTYSISATCTVNGCTSDASTVVTGLEIKAQPIISSSNTGPYTIGQIISLNGTGTGTYIWTGPNNFTSTLSNPTINNALSVNAGVYTLTVTGLNSCINTSTTNVVVNEIDPCDPTRIVDYFYVKAGNPYQTLFQLTDGMVINQMRDQVSILANPVCSSVTIESMEMNIQGPELNWNVLQNVPPNALFDNRGLDFFGRNFNPGNYTLTVTGYARDNKGGGITYGPKVIRFTVVGNLATINAPTLSKTSICAGSSVDVTFATSGTFNDINQYLIELSDTSGSFEKPLLIGTTNVTGTTTCLIPQNTVGGSKYLIRVVSSNQVVVSNPVISQVTVNPLNYSLVSPTNNLTGASTKKAVDSISASNKITSPANVVYEAGKSVLLTPGFESGAVFRAEVKSCDN